MDDYDGEFWTLHYTLGLIFSIPLGCHLKYEELCGREPPHWLDITTQHDPNPRAQPPDELHWRFLLYEGTFGGKCPQEIHPKVGLAIISVRDSVP